MEPRPSDYGANLRVSLIAKRVKREEQTSRETPTRGSAHRERAGPNQVDFDIRGPHLT
jgi:hypothetical protein